MTDARGLVVDTSAAVAILIDEPGAQWLTGTLAASPKRLMPTATYVELGIVIEARLGPGATGAAARFVRDTQVTLADLDAAAAERAVEGWRRYGRGRRRRAQPRRLLRVCLERRTGPSRAVRRRRLRQDRRGSAPTPGRSPERI